MLGGADPFNLDQNSPNSVFAFDGDRDARVEAAQSMKAEQDMSKCVEASANINQAHKNLIQTWKVSSAL